MKPSEKRDIVHNIKQIFFYEEEIKKVEEEIKKAKAKIDEYITKKISAKEATNNLMGKKSSINLLVDGKYYTVEKSGSYMIKIKEFVIDVVDEEG